MRRDAFAVALSLALLAACSGEDASSSGEALTCFSPARPGPRFVLEVVRAAVSEKDLYLFDLGQASPTCPVQLNESPMPAFESSDPDPSTRMSWSPDSTTFAYDAGAWIEVVDLRGDAPGPAVVIEHDGATDASLLGWSSDSRWLAYETHGSASSEASSATAMWVVHVADGAPGSPDLITSRDIFPSVEPILWHPTRPALVYTDGDDGSLRWIADVADGAATAQVVAAEGEAPVFAPTGDRVAFAYRGDLLVADLDGDDFGEPRSVITGGAGDAVVLAWSPGGTHLVTISMFEETAFVNDVTIDPTASVALNTGELEFQPDVDRFPGWVSDDRLYYETDAGIFVRDMVDGVLGDEINLTTGSNLEILDVAPDRKELVFGSANDEGEVQAFALSLEQGDLVPRPFGTPTLGAIGHIEAWYTPGGRRGLVSIHDEMVAYDLDEPEPEPQPVADESEIGGFPWSGRDLQDLNASWDDQLIFWDDPAESPARLLYMDLRDSPPWPVETLLEDAPLEWTFGNLAWAPAIP